MVLERLFKTKTLLHSPWALFFYTIIVTLISITVSVIFFRESASILSIAFITIAFAHFLYTVYYVTEKEVISHETSFFKRYLFVIEIYVKIFLVVALVFALLFVFLPNNYREIVFENQLNTLTDIDALRGVISGLAGNLTLSTPGDLFWYIFTNNLIVLLAILLFSFLYGAGSLFIIVYQASVFGTIIGGKILSLLPVYIVQGPSGHLMAILHGSFLGLGLLPHGIFELLAYFLAAVVGGIISAMLYGHYLNVRTHLFRIIFDLAILVLFALIFLLIGAWIESALILS